METPEQIAAVVRKALDEVGYDRLCRDTRFGLSVMHRMSQAPNVAIASYHRVLRVYAAAQAALASRKARPRTRLAPVSAKRKPQRTTRRKVA